MEWPLPLKFSKNKLAFVSNIPSLPPPLTPMRVSISNMSLLESIAQSFFIFKLLFSLITNQ